jgi:hypothetical protein
MEPFLFHRRIGEAIAILPIRAVGQVETNPADHFLRAHEHVVAMRMPACADWIFVLIHKLQGGLLNLASVQMGRRVHLSQPWYWQMPARPGAFPKRP